MSANIRPHLFSSIFFSFKRNKRRSFPEDLINQFLAALISNKNFRLIKELKQSDNSDNGQTEWFFDDNKIVASLIKDVSVADVNEVWKPFGNTATKEIENEINYGNNSKLLQSQFDDDLLWEYNTFVAIKFFNILIIESIVQKYQGTHFFLHYYWYITQRIIKNWEILQPIDFEDNESVYHHFIKEMNDYLIHWLDLTNKHESKGRFHDILNCIGNQLSCLTTSPYFGEERKVNLIEKLLYYYCSFETKTKTDAIRSKMEDILNKPTRSIKADHPYYNYMAEAWEKFDKIPHRGYTNDVDLDYFARLKENVIIPLGLDPDMY